ncbi:hypothetical protein BVRB_7g178390 [Beta vulgaris subsp. vulgaris]|nr:hypothetical protein BVRB_7g178390 [Beta vulgaris subsp. vulgaris]
MANPNQAAEMGKELYVAAMTGDVEFLQTDIAQSDEYLRRKTHENNNIIHIATLHEQHDFLQESLKRLVPNHGELISEKNSEGNTPFHVVAEVGNLNILKLLLIQSPDDDAAQRPWRIQNSEENTPLHVALIRQNAEIAKFLLEKDPDLVYVVNKSKEAPLHLAVKHHVNNYESYAATTIIKKLISKGEAPLQIDSEPGEDTPSMLHFLLEKGSCVSCWRDENGLTPLHRAASLRTPYNLRVIRIILNHWPQSAEVRDSFGNSILHLLISKIPNYQEGNKLLKLKEIYALRDYQNQEGDTPLHIAARNKDSNMVRVLFECSPKLTINNMEGIPAASLVQEKSLLEMLSKRKMTPDESKAAESTKITILNERMSRLGLVFLRSQDSNGRNILHKILHIKKESYIVQDEFVSFIKNVLGRCPSLVSQKDLRGDTPIHVLVRTYPETAIYAALSYPSNTQQQDNAYELSSLSKLGLMSQLVDVCDECILKNQEEASLNGIPYDTPWLVQNADGNTPLHEALIATNHKLAIRLLRHDQILAGFVNKRKETPLHLLAGIPWDTKPPSEEDIKLMVNANVKAAISLDKDGLTPLLRAFHAGNVLIAAILCRVSSEAADVPDPKGNTFWHLVISHPSDYYFFRLLRDPDLRDLFNFKDKNGNTLLHLAIEHNRFDHVQAFFETWKLAHESSSPVDWLVELLELQNKAGKTPGDLLGESSCLPPEVETSIGDIEMIGIRSMWGIPAIHMKTYVNTMGVIAALLTTITFTTAFTVPGGLNEISGIPIFMEKAAFQVAQFINDNGFQHIVAVCINHCNSGDFHYGSFCSNVPAQTLDRYCLCGSLLFPSGASCQVFCRPFSYSS